MVCICRILFGLGSNSMYNLLGLLVGYVLLAVVFFRFCNFLWFCFQVDCIATEKNLCLLEKGIGCLKTCWSMCLARCGTEGSMCMEETNLGLPCIFSWAVFITDRYVNSMYSDVFLKIFSFVDYCPLVVNIVCTRKSYKLKEK